MNKNCKNYAFIDTQNTYLLIKQQGWTLSWEKFFIFLREKYSTKKAFLFIGFIKENQKMYQYWRNCGFNDSELVLYCVTECKNFDKAIIVSSDGDFYCLIKYLIKNDKLLKIGIANNKRYSALLRRFKKYFFYFKDLKETLEHKKMRDFSSRITP